MKKIAVLGSTGSIGTQALDIIDKNPDKYSVSVLSGATKLELLSEQIGKYHPKAVAVANESSLGFLRSKYPDMEFLVGMDGLIEAASASDSDLVLNALVGMIGLMPTYAALGSGKDVALANKETLVAGGQLIMETASASGAGIIPVDSEHSAIFQCLEGQRSKSVNRLIITASGGPFRGKDRQDLKGVTLKEALDHPKWKMGNKITIDSATLMNKGLEVIEAHWLFGTPADRIDVTVHPQCVIHSMVEFEDHSILAQMGIPDMRIPIGYAFSYPDRLPNDLPGLDILAAGPFTFEEPDKKTFKCLQLAYDALKAGGSCPVVLNAANEELVGMFLLNKIGFLDIQDSVDRLLQEHEPIYSLSIESILEIDKNVRERVKQLWR